MARILGIDYGTKRIGISTTDPLQIIVTGLPTVATPDILEFLEKYIEVEEVECIVIGEPTHKDGSPTHIEHLIVGFIRKLERLFPKIKIDRQDERFTSIEAREIILRSGAKKKQRRNKGLVDEISAVLILQDYLGHR